MAESSNPYREVVMPDLAGGLNDSSNQTRLEPSQTPFCENVDFDSESIETSRGSIPFNRQTAPGTAIRTKVDPALSPLGVATGPIGGTGTTAIGVPLRGYVYFPYCRETDIGGDFAAEGDFLTASQTFHNRRGRTFQRDISFLIPPEEKLYEAETRGSAAPAVGAEATGFTNYDFDEALDECFVILQKGGDRTACMSWALAVVNVGKARNLTGAPASRASNYALCFLWYDAAQHGETDAVSMKYNLTTGQSPVGGAAAQFSTQAFRAILIHKYVEPGRRYAVAVQLKVDTGSPGSTVTNTSWNGDGYFKVQVTENGAAAPTEYSYIGSTGVFTNMEVIRGPSDGAAYLTKYGIRFSGRDAEFAGLGMRSIPWQTAGFIPYGSDAVALKNGGWQMADRSASNAATFYGVGVHTLTVQHTATDAYVVANHQGLVSGNTNGGANPWGFDTGAGVYSRWTGLGAGTVANSNTSALNGYKVVLPNDAGVGQRGARLPISGYAEVGASYRLTVGWPGASNSNWGPFPALIQCFRWRQRELVIGEHKMWAEPRNFSDTNAITAARRAIAHKSSIKLDDATEPDLATLVAYWPMDDAEGGVVSELVVGGTRNGFIAPFGMGQSDGGSKGKSLTFISGEGEAPCFDFSDNPVLLRELSNVISGASQGFGIEISCVFTEAFYAIQQLVTVPDSAIAGARARFVPTIMSLDVKNASTSGDASQPRPLIALTHNGVYTDTNGKQFQRPTGFFVEVAHRGDQYNYDPITPSDLLPFYLTAAVANVSRFDLNAAWVGKPVTMMVVVQSTGTPDQYDVALVMTPKDAFLPASGDPGDAEFAYWTIGGGSYANPHFSAAHITITKKDLARTIFTIGKWNPGTLGYAELQPRMLVDSITFYGSSPSGALPLTNGGILTLRNGKLEGTDCLPQRLLTREDLLQPVGAGVTNVNVTDGSVSVTPSTNAKFYEAEARTTLRAVKHTFLYVPGDPNTILKDEQSFGLEQEELYRIEAVALGGDSVTLAEAYAEATRSNASGYSLRVLAYTAFEDEIRDRLLTLGTGSPFIPGTSTTSDAILTEELWENVAPVVTNARLRIFSPLGRTTLRDILPAWTRGLSIKRTNPILGLEGFNDRRIAAVKGAIYEADDRWRDDGPSDEQPHSILFRAAPLVGDLTQGQQGDRVEYSTSTFIAYAADNSYVTIYDTWVKLTDIEQYQTVLWVGDVSTDPMQNASAAAGGHKLHCIMRFNRGRPEFVFGSTAFYTGTTVPEKGLFIATGASPISKGRWVQIRWYLQTYTNGAAQQVLRIPFLKVNGRKMSVTANAVDNSITAPAATDWLRPTNIVAGTGCKILLGVARDAYRVPQASISFSASNPQGVNVSAQRVQGFMHSLDGAISETVVSHQPPFSGSEPADFDPFAITYALPSVATMFHALAETPTVPLGVGHKVWDEPSDQYGVIYSHPFISLWHELGSKDLKASFAQYGQQMYVVNGSRVARVGPSSAGIAGVLPPTTKPSARLERLPLWKPNRRSTSSSSSVTNDPIIQALPGAALQINHYDNHGNNYWFQLQADTPGSSEITWTKDSSNFSRYTAFKCYLRMRDVSGRRVIWARRDGQRMGGPFVECVDGKVRVGWFDQYLKKDVYVETSMPVIEPGIVHYLYFRKRWPQQDAIEGNWMNSHFTNGDIRRISLAAPYVALGTYTVGQTITGGTSGATGRVIRTYGSSPTAVEYVNLTGAFVSGEVISNGANSATSTSVPRRPMHDSLVVRRLRTDTITTTNHIAIEAKYNNVTPIRQCVSFTTTALAAPAGTTATGMVSIPGGQYQGLATGEVDSVTAMAGVEPFHPDMVGMYFQWGSGGSAAAFVGKLYRIVTVVSSTRIGTIDEATGSAPNFAAVNTNTGGAVFTGVALVKSEDFDTSKAPDTASYDIMAFGTPEAVDPTSGFSDFDGEWWTPGWTTALSTVANEGTDARVFENVDTSTAGAGTADPILVGTDWFDYDILDGTTGDPGELHYDTWVAANQIGTWCSVDGQTYALAGAGDSTQPNVTLFTPSGEREPVVAHDTANPINSTNARDLVFRYLQAVADLTGKRFIRTRFYDPEQNELSDPSPAIAISPAAEDDQNPSGQIRVIVGDLPGTRQAGMIETWVYASLPNGDAVALFRVGKVPSGTREFSFTLFNARIGLGPPIDFVSGVPPRCEILAEAQGRVFYGALEDTPDGLVFSRAGAPVSINYAIPVTRLNSGFGEKLTMLRELDGYVVAAKRRTLASILVNVDETVTVSTVTTGVGCVAHQTAVGNDDRLYWVGEKGLYLAMRSGVTNLTKPTFVAMRVRRLFLEGFDRRKSHLMSATINRRRSQYVLSGQGSDSKRPRLRMSAGFDYASGGTELMASSPSTHRYSRYDGPNITALASVQASDGGLERMIAGTEEGLVLWMDRADSPLNCMGSPGGMWGFPSLTTEGTPLTTGTELAGQGVCDTALEGPRGCTLRYIDQGGVERAVGILGATSALLVFDEVADAAPVTDQPAALGSIPMRWETGWLDFQNPHKPKKGVWLNVVTRPEDVGSLQVDIYTDLDDETVVATATFDLSGDDHELDLKDAPEAHHWKAVLRTPDLAVGTIAQVPMLVWQMVDVGQT